MITDIAFRTTKKLAMQAIRMIDADELVTLQPSEKLGDWERFLFSDGNYDIEGILVIENSRPPHEQDSLERAYNNQFIKEKIKPLLKRQVEVPNWKSDPFADV